MTRLQRMLWSEFVVDKSLHITFVSTSWFNLVLSFQMFMLLTLSLPSSLSYRNQWTGFDIIGTSVLKVNLDINPFHANAHFLCPPESFRKSEGFLMFSGGIEMKHWCEMG